MRDEDKGGAREKGAPRSAPGPEGRGGCDWAIAIAICGPKAIHVSIASFWFNGVSGVPLPSLLLLSAASRLRPTSYI
jgi:hypothetical protein